TDLTKAQTEVRDRALGDQDAALGNTHSPRSRDMSSTVRSASKLYIRSAFVIVGSDVRSRSRPEGRWTVLSNPAGTSSHSITPRPCKRTARGDRQCPAA